MFSRYYMHSDIHILNHTRTCDPPLKVEKRNRNHDIKQEEILGKLNYALP